jgi:hypothetical protein
VKPIVLTTIALVCGASPTAAEDCLTPPGYANHVVVEDGDLRIRYATDRFSYGPADNVSFHLVVENIGATTVSINWGIDPQDGHFILRPPFDSLEDCCSTDADLEANVLFYLPNVLYFFSAGTTLAPGQCRVWQRTIDLEWATNVVPGTYAVLGGMLQLVASAIPGASYNMDFIAPSGGAKLTIDITGPVPTAATTWGRVKSLYR